MTDEALRIALAGLTEVARETRDEVRGLRSDLHDQARALDVLASERTADKGVLHDLSARVVVLELARADDSGVKKGEEQQRRTVATWIKILGGVVGGGGVAELARRALTGGG